MASCQTSRWVSSAPYVKLNVTQSASDETSITLALTLQYISDSAANTNGVARPFTVKVAGSTVKEGSYNINGVTGTKTIWTGTKKISKTTAAQTVAFSVSFQFNLTWSGTYGGTKSASGSISVPAKTSYKVTYNANGGSGAPSAQTKWHGTALTLSSTKPTRTGYSFQGWATSASGSVAYAAGASYTANAAVTLYAVWKANTYKVTYNANGGSGAPSAQTKTYGVNLTLSSTKPTRTNYTFKGWGTSASATTVAYTAGASYTTNAAITLYAIWELSYVKPRITNLSVTRCDSSGAASDNGTYALVKFDWACDQTVSSIVIKWKSASTSEESATVSASGTSGSVSQLVGSGTLSAESTYTVSVIVTDASGYSYAFGTLHGMRLAIDFMAGNKGASIGKPAELEGVFDVAFQTKLTGGLYPILLPAETDLNDVLIPNVYAGQNASTYNYGNCPLSSGTFSLEVTAQGPGGQIRQIISQCLKSNPVSYERTYYTSAWGEWQLLTLPFDTGWINLTLGSEFKQYGTGNPVRYRKIGEIVEVRGIVSPVADIAGSTAMHTIATLPSGARPVEPQYAICQGSGNCTWLFRVNNTGTLDFSRYRNGDATTTAAAGVWLPFQMTFMID